MNRDPGGAPAAAHPRRHQHGRVGAQVSRIDGPLKVTGAARFAAEVPLEGLTYAALVPSTIARGRIIAIDTAAAAACARRRAGDDARERAPDEGAADR